MPRWRSRYVTRPSPTRPCFSAALHPRKVLAKLQSAEKKSESSTHIPRSENKKQPLAELADDDADDNEDLDDPFSSPVGGGGAIGKLLGRMLSMVRKLSGGGQPGADSPTHRLSKGGHGRNAVLSQARPPTEAAQAGERRGTAYPEWDLYHRHYRPDWCTVHEIEPPLRPDAHLAPSDAGLRRPLARIGVGLQHYRRQADGDDIDIDAAIEARIGMLAGAAPEERVYLDTLRRRRDLSVLVLLDVSGSVAEPGTAGKTVHEQQRAGAAMLTVALHALGDRVALYAFSSQGRSAVNVTPVKQFHEPMDAVAMRRLYGLVPGAYSRLGAAIRHSAAILEERAGTPRRLLVVISDGLAYDPGYERDYGAADSRRALAEARQVAPDACASRSAPAPMPRSSAKSSAPPRTPPSPIPTIWPPSSDRCSAPHCDPPRHAAASANDNAKPPPPPVNPTASHPTNP